MKQKLYLLLLVLMCQLNSFGQTLDQSAIFTPGGINISSNVGQSFIAGLGGTLSKFSYYHYSTNSFSYQLRIYSGAGNSGTLLATQSFGSTTPTPTGELDVLISTPITVISGNIYTVYIVNMNTNGFTVGGLLNNPYVNGAAYIDNEIPFPTADLWFKTFVTATPATHLNFDGTNDHVSFPPTAINNLPQGTIETWVYLNSSLSNQTICAKQKDGFASDAIFMVGKNTNGFVTYNANNANSIASTTALAAGQWYHLAVTFNGTGAQLYINGVLNNTATGNFSLPNDTSNTNLTSIGAWLGGGGGRYLNGNIEEFRIWNVARTADQINGARNCELQGTETGLVTYYKFNQGFVSSNNTAITALSATTGTNGTLTNFTLTGATSNFLAGSPIISGIVVPTAPTAAAQTLCGSSPTVANLSATGTGGTIKWYNSATSTTALTAATAVTSATYYVTETNANGCESSRTIVVVTVGSIPTAPTATAQSFCTGATVSNLTAAGTGTLKWYNVATNGIALNGTTALTSGTYYATLTNASGCESTRTSSVVTVTQLPTVSAGTAPTAVCLGNNVTITGTAASNSFQNGFSGSLAPANWALTNTTTNGGVDATNAPNSIRLVGGNTNSTITGGSTKYTTTTPNSGTITFSWAYSTNDSNPVDDYPNIIVNGQTSFLDGFSYSGGLAQSGTMSVAVVAGQSFAFEMVTVSNRFGVGQIIISNLVYTTNPTVAWSTANGTIVGATNGLSATVSVAGTYTLTATNAQGCSASSNVVVSYLATPVAPTTNNVTYTLNATATALTATGSGLIWYTTAIGGTGNSNAPTPSTAATGSTTYWVSSKNANGCESARTPLVVTVTLPATHLKFDGVNDYISLPNAVRTPLSNGTELTIEYWFKGTNLQSGVRIQNGSNYIVAGFGTTNPQFVISTDGGTNGVSCGSETVIENDSWHHLAFVWKKNTVFATYLDGVIQGSRVAANVNLPSLSGAVPVIGSFDGGSDFLNGSLDELRIWNRALPLAEIQNNMNCELSSTPAQTGLIAYYKFNQGINAANNSSITTLTDSSGNNHTGNLNVFALNGSLSNWLSGSTIVTGTTCATLSNNSFSINSKLKIYPNPTQNDVTIQFDALTNPKLQVLDINGRILMNQELNNTSNTINTSNLPTGLYLFKVSSNEGSSVSKVIKN